MVSGFKKTNKKKKSGKLQLAKDPKQLKIAIIVVVLFILNTIYMGIKIYQENNPTYNQQAAQVTDPDAQPTMETPDQLPQGSTTTTTTSVSDVPNETTSTNNTNETMPNQTVEDSSTQPVVPAKSEPNYLLIVLDVILLCAAGALGNKYLKANPNIENMLSKNFSPKGKKGKLALAKDPKQLKIAITVIVLFALNTIYMIVKIYQENNPSAGGQSNDILNNVLIFLGVVLFCAVLFLASKTIKISPNSQKSFANNEPKSGKKCKKGKLELAKDPKQLIIAGIVVAIFILNTIYMGVKIYQENNPPIDQQTTTPDPFGPEAPQQDPAAMDTQNPLDSQAPIQDQASADKLAQDANDIYTQTIGMNGRNAEKLSTAPDSSIEIMTKPNTPRRFGKTVFISVDNSESLNPFSPDRDNVAAPVSLPFLTTPPENIITNSDAGKVMTTTISGILYDKYSPSAIINIEGADYLVKTGDVVNHYRILAIGKTQVIVQLGRNVYKAGVGELLSPTDLNHNTIANLNKKFGGNNVQISVKKKSY